MADASGTRVGRLTGLRGGDHLESRGKVFLIRKPEVARRVPTRQVRGMCTSRDFTGGGGRFLRGLRTPIRLLASAIFTCISSAGAPRKVLTVIGELGCAVGSLVRIGGRGTPRLIILSGLRSPKGLKAVFEATRTTNMAKVLLDGSYISICGPGIVHSAVKTMFHVPFLCIRSLPRGVGRLRGGDVGACTTRLHKRGTCSRRSCAANYTFLVKGRKGKLHSRITSYTSYLVHVPVRNRTRSLGTTITTTILVFRTKEREEGGWWGYVGRYVGARWVYVGRDGVGF